MIEPVTESLEASPLSMENMESLRSIAVSLKRIADAIVADIERHNSVVPGPLTRISDEICGVPYDHAPGADNIKHRLGLVDGVMHAIEQGIIIAARGRS